MRTRYLCPLVVLVALGSTACGDDEKTDPGASAAQQPVEIYSFWTSGGEAEALNHLIGLYEDANPGSDVLNSTSDDAAAAFAEMNTRLAAGDPPDSWQALPGKNLLSYTRFVPADEPDAAPENMVEELSDLYESEGWSDKFPPGVLASMKDSDGTYAVPLSVSRINEVFYNKAIFAEYDLDPPETVADLFTIGEALVGAEDGDGNPIIPMVISSGYEGNTGAWPVRFVFDAIMMARDGGIQFRQDYFTGKKDANDPMYLEAATDFTDFMSMFTNANAELVDPDSDDVPLKLQWEGAADMVHSGRAAMFLHGNWVKAYLESKGDEADNDFGVVQFPRKAFVYAGDSFVVSKDAPHKEAAMNFLKLIGSPDAQSSFNEKKGALPARIDADTSGYDTIGKQAADDFRDPTVSLVPAAWEFPPTEYWSCWELSVLDVVGDLDADAFASACDAEYDEFLKQ
jgi:glucose/mannose transport system substrate-binding protein